MIELFLVGIGSSKSIAIYKVSVTVVPRPVASFIITGYWYILIVG